MNTEILEQEQQLAEQVEESRGLFYHEEVGEDGETQAYVNIMGIDVPTYATAEDIEQLAAETIRFPIDQEIMRTIAECYLLRQPLLIEARPGMGKTYHLEQFTKLVHGVDAPIHLVQAGPRTNELEILGRWAPVGTTAQDREHYYQTLEHEMRDGELRWFMNDLRSQVDLLKVRQELGQLSVDEASERASQLLQDYTERTRTLMMDAVRRGGQATSKSDWQFIPGFLTKAYVGNNGRGCISILDEFNLLASNYQQLFLTALGGRKGSLNDRLPGNDGSGVAEYRRGPDTWIAFAINSPETTEGRNVVADSMTDRVRWLTISPEQNEEKRRLMAQTGGGRSYGRTRRLTALNEEFTWVPAVRPIQLALTKAPEVGVESDQTIEVLGDQINDVLDLFDVHFQQLYKGKGDRVEGQRRIQMMEFSYRNQDRTHNYLERFQIRDEATGNIDMARTVRFALERYYIDRISDNELRQAANAVLDQILTGNLGSIEFEGEVITRADCINRLAGNLSWNEGELAAIAAEQERQTAEYVTALTKGIGDWFYSLIERASSEQLRHELTATAAKLGFTAEVPAGPDSLMADFAAETGSLQPGATARIVFEERTIPNGGVEWRSCAPGRKIMKLEANTADTVLPKIGREHTVIITRDTVPGDPNKGILYAKLAILAEDEVLDCLPSFDQLAQPLPERDYDRLNAVVDKLRDVEFVLFGNGDFDHDLQRHNLPHYNLPRRPDWLTDVPPPVAEPAGQSRSQRRHGRREERSRERW